MMASSSHEHSLQEQARALGDPTRHGIFRYIADAGGPVGVAELTDRFGFNHNAIRQHLAKLVAAGLVSEGKARGAGRGRPRLLYTLDPAAEGKWGTEGPYERLSRLLVEVIGTGTTPEEAGRRSSAEASRRTGGANTVDALLDEMTRQGFDPELRERRTGPELVLRHCPFGTAAAADPDTVCAIHLGIARGLTEGSMLTVDELIANDPRTANCRLRLRLADENGRTPEAGSLTIRERA